MYGPHCFRLFFKRRPISNFMRSSKLLESFTFGNGPSGTGTPRNSQRGSHPSFPTRYSSRFSFGTNLLISAWCSSKACFALRSKSLSKYASNILRDMVNQGLRNVRSISETMKRGQDLIAGAIVLAVDLYQASKGRIVRTTLASG